MKKSITLNEVKAVLFGVAVGDALGVPVEFQSREMLAKNPVLDMRAFGSHHQPAGTWSDDSSLTFCLAEALTEEFYLNTIGENFVKWGMEQYWTPRGAVFDIGFATMTAIQKIADGTRAELAGGTKESDNGNGSLMRILPLLFYLHHKPIKERFQLVKDVSSITHGHIRSAIACFYHIEFARNILEGKNKFDVYQNLKKTVVEFLKSIAIDQNEIKLFDRLLQGDIYKLPENEIRSSGYVIDTLEAAIWCLLTTNTYKEAVLKAVNLGRDTDTSAAVTGGLAGLLYGFNKIPSNWIEQIVRKNDIEDLANRLFSKLAAE